MKVQLKDELVLGKVLGRVREILSGNKAIFMALENPMPIDSYM